MKEKKKKRRRRVNLSQQQQQQHTITLSSCFIHRSPYFDDPITYSPLLRQQQQPQQCTQGVYVSSFHSASMGSARNFRRRRRRRRRSSSKSFVRKSNRNNKKWKVLKLCLFLKKEKIVYGRWNYLASLFIIEKEEKKEEKKYFPCSVPPAALPNSVHKKMKEFFVSFFRFL